MTNLPPKGNADSMDNVAVTREEFRQDIGEFLEFSAQALGNVTGTYTTAAVDPLAVVLQGTPTLASGADPVSSDSSLRIPSTQWVKRNAASASATAPAGPVDGQLWVDIGADPPVAKVWDASNTRWITVGATPANASETVAGIVELATATETTTGTDDTRAVHPAGLKVELDKKVDLAGDTMTGNLTVPSLNGGQLAGFRNVLINGNLTINQRNVNISAAATGKYGQDRWKKTSGGMTQIIEAGNFDPGATYTLSGTGVTTQQLTAPGTGDWTLPDIPVTARKVQLELGPVATPFEHRPIGTELALCQRYYQKIDQIYSSIGGIADTKGFSFTLLATTRVLGTVAVTTTGVGTGTWSGNATSTNIARIFTDSKTTRTFCDMTIDAEL